MIELLVRGDCACGFGDADALERICTELKSLVPNMAIQVERVAYWVALDMRAAAQFWARLATELRHGESKPGARETRIPSTTFV
jgi:hypothetical protein